jgi:P27 family predicted phage terminase small subunit
MAGVPGRSGRKRKPTILHAIEGTKDRRPAEAKAAEPKPAISSNVPPAPKHLPPMAKEYWVNKAKELHAMGLLTDVDLTAFEQLCMAWHDWRYALDQKGMGYWVANFNKPKGVDPNTGETQYEAMVNPYIRIEAQEQKKLRSMEVEFGLTPSSRARVKPVHLKLPGEGAQPNNPAGTPDPKTGEGKPFGGLLSVPRVLPRVG